MVNREFWRKQVEQLWERRSIVWLKGVRRAGKTSLAQTLGQIEYFDCELPRVRRTMDDPEEFLTGLHGKRMMTAG